MDFDPLTEGFPTRTALEEEEEDAEATAGACFEPALVSWCPAVQATLATAPLAPSLMVVAVGAAPCALMHHCCRSSRTLLGSISLPELSMAGNAVKPSLGDSSCFVYGIGGGSDVLLVQCQYAVRAERAHSWASALLGGVRAVRTVIVSVAMPSEIQLGQALAGGGAEAETPVFRLDTDAWRRADATEGPREVQPLPSGNVIGGLSARVLGKCQAMGMQACAVVLRQPTPSPDATSLKLLAGSLQAILKPLKMVGALGLDDAAAVKEACGFVEAAHWHDGVTGNVYL